MMKQPDLTAEVKRTTAWAIFYAGHLVSKAMNSANFMGRLYPLYNWLMVLSDRVQGDGKGPWKAP